MISVKIPKNSDRMPKHSNYKVRENPGEGGGGGGGGGGEGGGEGRSSDLKHSKFS